jgi:hypothetical protein
MQLYTYSTQPRRRGDGWRESTHDRSALPIGKRPPRTNSENGKLSVSETFCDTWTQFFWGHRKPLQCNITASVSLDRLGAHHDHDMPQSSRPAVPIGRKGKGRQAKIPSRRLLPHTPDLIRSSSSPTSNATIPPPCSPSAYPRTVFRIISVSSSLTLLI